MYSSRGCSPSLNNLSTSKLINGIEIDESEYHSLIDLRHNNKVIERKNKIGKKDPNTKLIFTHTFEDSMLQESNENDGFYDEERNTQFEKNVRQKETLNDESERGEKTENVDVGEERGEETGNAEEEENDAEREEDTESTEEEDEDEECGDTGDDEGDTYSTSEVASDIDNDVLEEEGDAQDNIDNEWDAITDLTPELEACTLNESTFNIPIEDISPAGTFSLFVTDEIIDKMVIETNRYATKYITEKQNNNEMKTKSRFLSWKATYNIEMRKFLGVILAMGLNKVPHINDYWSKKTIYQNQYIASVMTRDRFLLLLKFWHFCDDSSAIHNTNKLKKIHDLANMLNNKFQEVLTPGKFVVIDESMIPWRGRLKFKQYIKNKSHKYGVKIYKLCTPEGYTYNSIIYSGKGENGREQNHGKVTVLKLIQGLENKCRTVIADNFYSSIDLAEEHLTKPVIAVP